MLLTEGSDPTMSHSQHHCSGCMDGLCLVATFTLCSMNLMLTEQSTSNPFESTWHTAWAVSWDPQTVFHLMHRTKTQHHQVDTNRAKRYCVLTETVTCSHRNVGFRRDVTLGRLRKRHCPSLQEYASMSPSVALRTGSCRGVGGSRTRRLHW